MSSSEIDQSDDEFGVNIDVRRKSVFMELTFEERVFKMRNYLTDTTWPFYHMSKEDKRNFRRLSKQFTLDANGQKLKKKIHLKRKAHNGKSHSVTFFFFFFNK